MTKRVAITLSLFILLVLPSCTIIKRQYGYVEPSSAYIPKSNCDVLQKMGAPDSVAVLNDAYIFAYYSITINEPQLGLAIPSFDFLKFTLGSATANHSYHFYAFTLEGKIINLQNSHWQNALGDSSSFGLIFVIEETIDLANFEVPRATNLWGQAILLDKPLLDISFEDIILAKRLDLIGQNY
jgi:hypothetical protein